MSNPSPARLADAGRELDALIAEKVMDYEWRRFEYPPAGAIFKYGKPWTWLSSRKNGAAVEGGEERYIENVPHYSTDIAAAWLVVEKMRADSFCFDLTTSQSCDPSMHWSASFEHEQAQGRGRSAAAPHAICLAAIAALSEDAHA